LNEISGPEWEPKSFAVPRALTYYSIYREKTIEGLTSVRSQAFFIRRQRKKMIINPIKKRRMGKRLTQVDLALLVGVSQAYISQFETGGLIPSEIQTKKITEILGISPKILNKELHQFYEDRKKELKERIKERLDNA
jgi:DNA-binding XRE family transcriptional regulator